MSMRDGISRNSGAARPPDEPAAGLRPGDFDPFDAATVADPHATYARLRDSCPVARGTRWDGFWALTTYADVVAASTAPGLFSSESGVVIPINPLAGRRLPMHFDPPEHTAYRRMLNPAFHSDRTTVLGPEVRRIAGRLLAPLVSRGAAELIGEYASPLASHSLAAFLGMPEEFGTRLEEHSVRFERAQDAGDAAAVEAANRTLYEYAREVHAEHRGRDDPSSVVNVLAGGLAGGRPLAEEEIVGSVRQIFIAGHIAIAAALGSAVRHLAEDPALQERLRREPALVPDAIEELLRLHTPNQGFARTATEDISVRGTRIRAGEQVALVYTSANRDPAVFQDPDSFDLGRKSRHLAFGHGVHKCVGMELARMELRTGLTALLAATASFGLAAEPEPLRWPVHGPATLPVDLIAASC
jgi:cytochrome P450